MLFSPHFRKQKSDFTKDGHIANKWQSWDYIGQTQNFWKQFVSLILFGMEIYKLSLNLEYSHWGRKVWYSSSCLISEDYITHIPVFGGSVIKCEINPAIGMLHLHVFILWPSNKTLKVTLTYEYFSLKLPINPHLKIFYNIKLVVCFI